MEINVKTATPLERKNTRIWLNGEEVTRRCMAANDSAGWVDVYKLDQDGKKYIDPASQSVAWERLYGKVRIKCPTP